MYDNQYHHNRNYGCRQTEIILKGYRALVMENEKLRATILLDKGSDLYELLYKPADIDFMWRSPLELDGRNRNPVTRELENGSVHGQLRGGVAGAPARASPRRRITRGWVSGSTGR